MDRLFNMDNKFFTVMGRVADLIMLNVVFLICCLPIVTIGASLTALHYVTLKMTRNEESYIIRSFFKSFKQNFKQATVINLIMLAVAASWINEKMKDVHRAAVNTYWWTRWIRWHRIARARKEAR